MGGEGQIFFAGDFTPESFFLRFFLGFLKKFRFFYFSQKSKVFVFQKFFYLFL